MHPRGGIEMSIKIIKEPDVHVTEGELARYRAEYERVMSYYAGPPITLEEFIRGRKARDSARKP